MAADPSDADLRVFIDAMLSNLDKRLREPAVIDDAIRAHREMWVLLFRASTGDDAPS